jgi:hypothetical protein
MKYYIKLQYSQNLRMKILLGECTRRAKRAWQKALVMVRMRGLVRGMALPRMRGQLLPLAARESRPPQAEIENAISQCSGWVQGWSCGLWLMFVLSASFGAASRLENRTEDRIA